MKMLPIALATVVLWSPMDSIAGGASENLDQLPEIVVTAQKRAEQALRVSEERYRTLFETMTEGFGLCEMIAGNGSARPLAGACSPRQSRRPARYGDNHARHVRALRAGT